MSYYEYFWLSDENIPHDEADTPSLKTVRHKFCINNKLKATDKEF